MGRPNADASVALRRLYRLHRGVQLLFLSPRLSCRHPSLCLYQCPSQYLLSRDQAYRSSSLARPVLASRVMSRLAAASRGAGRKAPYRSTQPTSRCRVALMRTVWRHRVQRSAACRARYRVPSRAARAFCLLHRPRLAARRWAARPRRLPAACFRRLHSARPASRSARHHRSHLLRVAVVVRARPVFTVVSGPVRRTRAMRAPSCTRVQVLRASLCPKDRTAASTRASCARVQAPSRARVCSA